eukprot:PhF_6_TR7310/c0_g1_i1/m.10954
MKAARHQDALNIQYLIEKYQKSSPIKDANALHVLLVSVGIMVLPDGEGVGTLAHWLKQAKFSEPVYPLSFDRFKDLYSLFRNVKRTLVQSTRNTDAEHLALSFGDEIKREDLQETCKIFMLQPDLDEGPLSSQQKAIPCRDFLSWAAVESTSWGLTKAQSMKARAHWMFAINAVMNRVRSAHRVKRLIKGSSLGANSEGRRDYALHNAEELEVTSNGIVDKHVERIKGMQNRSKVWDYRPVRVVKEVEDLAPTKVTIHQALMRMCVGLNGDSVSCQMARKLRDLMYRTRATIQNQHKRKRRAQMSKK